MKWVMTMLILLMLSGVQAQEKPAILYISGDGGMNDFSNSLTGSLSKYGYAVQVINARNYFWKKKTPEQAAADIGLMLNKLPASQPIALIGFSFGADVLPFIIPKLPAGLQSRLRTLVLIAPSASTDFEIHLSEMLGLHPDHPYQLVNGLNGLSIPKTLAILDAADTEFKPALIHLAGFSVIRLSGGHHFDGNADQLSAIIRENL